MEDQPQQLSNGIFDFKDILEALRVICQPSFSVHYLGDNNEYEAYKYLPDLDCYEICGKDFNGKECVWFILHKGELIIYEQGLWQKELLKKYEQVKKRLSSMNC